MTSTRPRDSAVERNRERVEEKAARRKAAAEAARQGPAEDPHKVPAGGPSELVFITRDIAPGAIERSLAAFSRIGTARRPAPDRSPENT